MTEQQTVKEWISSHCQHGTSEFDDQIKNYADKKIIREFDGTEFSFPQPRWAFRNVMNWVLLEDGSCVGWNESPRSGWSFPRTGKKTTGMYLEAFRKNGKLKD